MIGLKNMTLVESHVVDFTLAFAAALSLSHAHAIV